MIATAAITIGGLLLKYGPDLARWLVGERAGEVMEQGKEALNAIVGTTNPRAAEEALAANPAALDNLRLELARIAEQARQAERDFELAMYSKKVEAVAAEMQASIAAVQADVANTNSARQMSQNFAASGSYLAWGSAVVTAVLLGLFCYVIISGADLAADMRETVKNLVIMAAGYWIGSSRGSAAKDEQRGERQPPTAIATTGTVIAPNNRANADTGENDDDDSAGRANRRRR